MPARRRKPKERLIRAGSIGASGRIKNLFLILRGQALLPFTEREIPEIIFDGNSRNIVCLLLVLYANGVVVASINFLQSLIVIFWRPKLLLRIVLNRVLVKECLVERARFLVIVLSCEN